MANASVLTLFDEQEIRAAEKVLAAALSSADPTAWVYEYTEDAVFDGGGEHVVQGRAALLDYARTMQPMRAVSLRPRRTEGAANLATVWCDASWISGAPDAESVVEARGMMLWRKDTDGRWRVAIEHLGPAG